MYARVKLAQVEHPHVVSSGQSRSDCNSRETLTRPVDVNAVPCHARCVGKMQSNMSTPASIACSRSGGVPTPIR